MEVIVSDIDGTLVDVNGRIVAVLEEIGVTVGDPALADHIADGLDRKQRNDFYRLFLSEKYTHLDVPVPEVIEAVRKLQAETGLPLVMLSGRPNSMRKSTRAVLKATGLEIQETLLRPPALQMQKTTLFKVGTLQRKGYEPRYALDDDTSILAAFAAAFPGITLFKVEGPQTTAWPE